MDYVKYVKYVIYVDNVINVAGTGEGISAGAGIFPKPLGGWSYIFMRRSHIFIHGEAGQLDRGR